MAKDIDNLQGGSDAKFNAHIALLERLEWIMRNVASLSTDHTAESLAKRYDLLLHVQNLMWTYADADARQKLTNVKPVPYAAQVYNSFSCKQQSAPYSTEYAERLGDWERELNYLCAKLGLQFKSGKDPSSAMVES